jgi:MFS family permease
MDDDLNLLSLPVVLVAGLLGAAWEAWDRVLTGWVLAGVWIGALAGSVLGGWLVSHASGAAAWAGLPMLAGVPFAIFSTVTWWTKVADEKKAAEVRSGAHRLFPPQKYEPKPLRRAVRVPRRKEPDLR